jgi:hypothetical protein
MSRPVPDDGISEVIGFVMIIALLMAGLSLYLVYAVPVQGREDEIREMDGVREWFVDYKTGVDRLWMAGPAASVDPNLDAEEIAAEFEATIGGTIFAKTLDPGTAKAQGFVQRYLPLFGPIRSTGEISMTTGDTLTVSAQRGSTPIPPVTYAAPRLTYRSHNNYWLQQNYTYQLGGVFLSQWDPEGGSLANTSVVAAPPFTVNYRMDQFERQAVGVELGIVNFSDIRTGGIGSSSPVRVEARLDSDPAFQSPDGNPAGMEAYDNITLTFHSDDTLVARAWWDVFNDTVTRETDPQTWEKIEPDWYDQPVFDPATNNATIILEGPFPEKGVELELLVANYSVRMMNVPTMIE